MTSEMGTGRTIFVLAIVVGCFAVLWPKIFYPMLTASVGQSTQTKQDNEFRLVWENDINEEFFAKMCSLLVEREGGASKFSKQSTPKGLFEGCNSYLKQLCEIKDVNEGVIHGFRTDTDKTNLTACLKSHFGIDREHVAKQKKPESKHLRQERPAHHYPEMLHPSLREKGRPPVPQRTIEKQARPGPMPGMRPPMGGGGGGGQMSPQTKGSGAMGIIMPLYTVGIVVFFIYTIMKVLFKKGDEDQTPKIKDFHLDPDYRKYVFHEEYADQPGWNERDMARREERKSRRLFAEADAKLEDLQMDQLRRRLEETEVAMEKLMAQMGSVTDKLTAAKITQVLAQAQQQAKILKGAEANSSSKGSSPDMDEYEVINKGS